MKPTHKVTSRKKTDIDPSALLLLSVCFAVGAIIGCIAVSAVSNNGYVALSGYIQDFVKSIQGDNLYLPNLFSVIWSVLRWPLFAWLLSYFALGVIGIPILFMVRGFLLAFCISSFVRVLGQAGILFMCMLV